MYPENNITPAQLIITFRKLDAINICNIINPINENNPIDNMFSIKEKSFLLRNAIDVRTRKIENVIPADLTIIGPPPFIK